MGEVKIKERRVHTRMERLHRREGQRESRPERSEQPWEDVER